MPFRVGTFCTFRKWQKLSRCHISGIPLAQADVAELVNQLPSGRVSVKLVSVYLLKGSWSEVLDILRNKSIHYCRIFAPTGGECNTMRYEDHRAIFGTGIGMSVANQYLQGTIDDNPFRQLEGH